MEKYAITISRQFASMGRTIAQKMAENLQIEFYDRDIVEATAKRMGKPVSFISDTEENSKPEFFLRNHPFRMNSYKITDEIFAVQKNIIEDLAAKESCIIVGRCAESILQGYPNHLSIYIYASEEARLYNCTHNLMLGEKEAKRMMKEVDAARTNYQRRYCPEVKTIFDHRDIMIDSSRFGIDQTAEILTGIVKEKWHEG